METITNLANTAANAATKLVYGEPAATNTTNETTATATTRTNETAGREPISGEQGRGTASDPFDHGNAATPLEKTSGSGTSGFGTSESGTSGSGTFLNYQNLGAGGQEPISGVLGEGTASQPYDQGNTANPASTLNQLDSRPTGYDSTPFVGSQATGISDKVWKETPVDNVSTSVISSAPYDPDTNHTRPAPDHPFETTGHESLRQSTNPFTTETSNFDPVERTGTKPSRQSNNPFTTETSNFDSTEKSSFSPISSVPVPIQGSHVDSHDQSTFGSTEKSHSSSIDKAGIPVPVEKIANKPSGSSGLPAVDTPPVEYKYEGSGAPVAQESGAVKGSSTGFEKAIQNSTPATTTSTGLAHDSSNPATSSGANRLAGDKSSHTYGSTTSPMAASSSAGNATGDNHESKMSAMKEKFMDKLHIGHK